MWPCDCDDVPCGHSVRRFTPLLGGCAGARGRCDVDDGRRGACAKGNDDSSQDDSDGGGGCAWAKDGYLLRGKPNREGGASRDMTFDDGGSIEKWGGSPLVLCISSPKKLHVFV